MSSLFLDTDIWLVKITMQSKTGGSDASYSFTLDWHNANAIFSGSAETYPLLAANPTITRSVGIYAGIRNDCTIEIYGKSDMTAKGTSFLDLLESYEIQNADVDVRYYPRSRDAATTDSDDNTQGKLKATAIDYDELTGIARLTARDVWFKDKEVSKRLTLDAIPGLDPKFDGEYGAIVFGQSSDSAAGIVIDAPVVQTTQGNAGMVIPSYTNIFSGFTFDEHPNKALVRVLCKNQHKKLDDTEWLTLNLDDSTSAGLYAGDTDTTGGTSFSLAEYWRGLAYSPDDAVICDTIGVYLGKTGTIADGDGNVDLDIYFGETTGGALPWAPVGSQLRSMKISGAYADLSTPGLFYFLLNPPLLLNPEENYFPRLSWSNTDDTTNYIYTKVVSDSGWTHFSQDKAETEKSWTTQADVRLPMSINTVGGYWNDGYGDFYSLYLIEGSRSYMDSSAGSSGDPPIIQAGLQFKIGVKGIRDDTIGTFTGSAESVIENGSDLVRFILMNTSAVPEYQFGLGLTTDEVDTAKLDSVRTSLAALSIGLKIVIDRQTYAEDLILEIARQTRTIFYKTRVGKLALHFPVTTKTNVDYTFNEAFHRGDFILEYVRDNEYSQVVNFFRQYYAPDTTNLSNDPAVIRRSEREKLSGKLELSSEESTLGDTARQALCTASEALYGRREHTAPLNFHDSAAGAKVVQNYLFDRYSRLQKRFRLSVPMRAWYNVLDYFTDIRAVHSGIPNSGGTAIEGAAYDAGTGLRLYDEGIPGISWFGGSIEGQVVEVQCQGPWMTVTCETTAVF